ncbi:MAG: glycerol-3-phosphate cytidylyltransferase [Flavobacteriaceae bacterium]|nr:glycerol-3-phosphate cytidylyltransferase [Flavobacteriaceae bacterium]
MKKIITYGTFDIFHSGHLELLKRIKELGDYVIVGVSTDEFNLTEKNKISYFPYKDRKAIIEALKYVDLVIPEESWEQKIADIKKYDIDIFVIGNDWETKFDYLKDYGIEVIYLERTPNISTSTVKKELKYK